MFLTIESRAQDGLGNGYYLLFEEEKSELLEALMLDFSADWVLKKPDTLAFVGAKKTEIEPLLIEYLRKKNYIAASIDTQKGADTVSKLHLGSSYKWTKIRPKGTIERTWLRAADVKYNKWEGAFIDLDGLFAAEKRLLEQAENHGYPFAKAYLDSLNEEGIGEISAVIVLEKGPFFTFDALAINSPNKIPKRYLSNILGIQEGEAFSRQRILDIEKRLSALPFLQMKESPKVLFGTENAQVRLTFEEKKANRFDFLIGLLPQGGGTNRTILTGSLDALFHNALNQGERFELRLERLRPETQRADVKFSAPYLLGLPFGTDMALHLHKRDSSFLDANSQLGVSYLFQNGDQVKVFWENKTSSLLTVDTSKIIQSRRLPDALDYRRNGLGIAWRHSSLDYLLNPRSGIWVDLGVSVGLNRTLRNATIEKISTGTTDFTALYDGLTLSATRLQSSQEVQFYQPLLKRSTLKLGIQGFGLFSNSPIYRNEQYRLGGTNSIRGFDEESIFATKAAFATTEYRLLLSRDAHLSAFSDYGYFENKTAEVDIIQWLLSFGVGMALQTGSGQFNISVATGRSNSKPLDFRASKFHLGFVSYF